MQQPGHLLHDLLSFLVAACLLRVPIARLVDTDETNQRIGVSVTNRLLVSGPGDFSDAPPVAGICWEPRTALPLRGHGELDVYIRGCDRPCGSKV